MSVQAGLCRTWSETPKTGFLRTRLKVICSKSANLCVGKIVSCECLHTKKFHSRPDYNYVLDSSLSGTNRKHVGMVRLCRAIPRFLVNLNSPDIKRHKLVYRYITQFFPSLNYRICVVTLQLICTFVFAYANKLTRNKNARHIFPHHFLTVAMIGMKCLYMYFVLHIFHTRSLFFK